MRCNLFRESSATRECLAEAKILHLRIRASGANHMDRQSTYSDPDIRVSVNPKCPKVSAEVSCDLKCEQQGRINNVFMLVILSFIFLWQGIISQKCKNFASSGSMGIENKENNLIMKAGKIDKASQMSIYIIIDYTGSQVRYADTMPIGMP